MSPFYTNTFSDIDRFFDDAFSQWAGQHRNRRQIEGGEGNANTQIQSQVFFSPK